ncbi:hypothetical protein [Cognaticolwellia beringensis]|jgi:hypothetical protein|uniref:Uncharacterized protein n=1 Tax=Cognaticolwellia beringensis TaxID=1967665 RepID=A0A222GD67_9GAMM|nr:hypothetical protein [Cognaticolwellia beringensis]ASP47407.1 hypothetical protein B5D82_06330 [Cognaticolwellia beringensis]ASP49806.1 hypothetical protein B5D82_19765 [Cognaticolwellia beringensis]
MNNNEIESIKIQSNNLYKEVCDPTSLIYINLEETTLKAIVDKFLDTKTSKTDFNVLINLMDFWDKKTSFIYVESFDLFRLKTGVVLTNGNLSRAIKSLEEKGFIIKVGYHNKLEYLFNIPFQLLKDNF